jgi:hypothetical protein
MPQQTPAPPGTRSRAGPTQVLLASGHRTDDPDRDQPRFPESRVGWVTAQVRQALADWQVGPGWLLVTGGARGADLIAAQEALETGAAVRLCLALPPHEFVARSVAAARTDWPARFHRVAAAADVRVLPPDAAAGLGADPFARANAWMVDVVRALTAAPRAVVVWNGTDGDGPGGTRDLLDRLALATDDRERLRVIDPTPPGDEAVPDAPGPDGVGASLL